MKLIGNPYSVDDGHGDRSFGYDKTDDKEFLQYVINDPDLLEDVNTIVEAYKSKGYDLEPRYAYYAWSEYSQSQSAGWLHLGEPGDKRDDWIISVTRKFLKEGDNNEE